MPTHPSQFQQPQQLQLNPQLQPYWQPPLPVSKQKNGLAITALVVASLALLIGLGLGVAFVAAGFSSAGGGLEGTAPQVVAGRAYSATLLQHEVTRVIGGDRGDVTSISCPATPVVATDAVALCHGVIDGLDSSVRVTFEDGLGHFTLVEN